MSWLSFLPDLSLRRSRHVFRRSLPVRSRLQRSWQSIPLALSLSIVAITLLGIVFGTPLGTSAQTLLAQVRPTTPQLGDTITVNFRAKGDTEPKVRLGAKTYQAFALNANQYRTFLPTTPLDKPGTLTIQVSDGADIQNLQVNLQNRSFPTQRIWLPPGKDSNLDEYEFDRVDAFKAIVSPQKYWNGPLLRPNSGPVTTGYGVRRYYNGVFAKDYFHRGVDYAGPSGSPIIAPAAGRVALVGRESQRFKVHGNCVGLDHGQGVESIFLHMSRIDVKEGDFVKAGQVLGTLGNTGASTGPHLHWGLYVFGQAVDPVPWRNQTFN
ncbi:MAG: M23 family metallopeptidase [Thermosynechococcaceae cyanobacterium MS004]|nr:M23 family metallopeptidase [Thermosynechococcaceae cyanobacterium MS004]